MAFAQLLKKTTFASFDPAITRVYTSTPHSVNVYGDWGLKYPIHRRKGPKYIKVHELDAGRLLGSDWRSAETEARFVEAFGDGRTPWKHEDETSPRHQSRTASLFDEFEAEEIKYMDDVNAMRPQHLKRYLADVRQYRKEYLSGNLQRMTRQAQQSLSLPEDRTFVNLAARGHIRNMDTSEFQVALAKHSIDSQDSKRLNTVPHRLYGLSYSRIPASASQHNATLIQPGRSVQPFAAVHGSGTNRPHIISMAGTTGLSFNRGGRISEGAAIPSSIDFSRENPNSGDATFRIPGARVKSSPTVVDVTRANRPSKRDSVPSRHTPEPLSTFTFDIDMEYVPAPIIDKLQQTGTREWVARDPRAYAALQLQDWMGIGGPKAGRTQGETLRSLKAAEESRKQQVRVQGSDQIAKILAKLAKKTPGKK